MKSLREQKKRNNFLKKKPLIIAGVSVVALLLIGGGWYAWQRQNASIPTTPTVAENEAAVKTETQPQQEATPADANENSESAKNNGETPTTTPSTQNGKKQVTPSITFAGYADATKQQVEVDAFVQGTLEDGGTCTMTATKGGQKVTAQSTGRTNVSQTRCENIIVDRAKFPSGGTWSVVVSYESAAASGSSAPQNMEL